MRAWAPPKTANLLLQEEERILQATVWQLLQAPHKRRQVFGELAWEGQTWQVRPTKAGVGEREGDLLQLLWREPRFV